MGNCVFDNQDHELAKAKKSWILRSGFIIIAFELTAFLMLKNGMQISTSIVVSVTGAAITIFWRNIYHFGWNIRNAIRNGFKIVARRAKDRTTWQFSLRTLLLVFVLVALICGWYRYQLNKLYHEQSLIYGKWRAVDENGKPIIYNGAEMISTLDIDNCTIYPTYDPKWIDFHDKLGDCKGIYCFEGNRLRVSQSSPGAQRPATFSLKEMPVPESGVLKYSIFNKTVSLWERIPEEKNLDHK